MPPFLPSVALAGWLETEEPRQKPYIVPGPGLPIEDLFYSPYLNGSHGIVADAWREDAEAGEVAR